jgi:hypothetical protein
MGVAGQGENGFGVDSMVSKTEQTEKGMKHTM